jgi:hypothetical protein
MDAPVILAALPPSLRYRVTTAMAKEFFQAHFYPEQYGRRAWLANSLNYYLAALFFNAFPLPQREAGARQTLRYIGEVLESGRGAAKEFSPGTLVVSFPLRRADGMIAARLRRAGVPVRPEGLEKVLHPSGG